MNHPSVVLLTIASVLSFLTEANAQHRLVTQGNDRLVVFDHDGDIEWEIPWGGIHDIHQLENGNLMVQRRMKEIVEIDVETGDVIWTYDAQNSNGNRDRPVEVHAFQPLEGGNVMIAESGPARIIEIDRAGELIRSIDLVVDNPHVHTDTRLARKLENGNYLVCHEADGVVREYDGNSGKVVWSFEVPLFGKERKRGHGPEAFGNKVFAAVRLETGNTLIATGNGHSVLEVNRSEEIVWQLHQRDLDGITLAWVTTLEVLPNGNYVIGNCHAGPGNPLLIEIDPATKQVVWTFEQFELLGNSVSNSQILDPDLRTLR